MDELDERTNRYRTYNFHALSRMTAEKTEEYLLDDCTLEEVVMTIQSFKRLMDDFC